jgi:hypothetical protein
MRNLLRMIAAALAVTVAFAGGAWSASAQGQRGQGNREGHPVLERAIDQITNIKGRLQSAPKDFGGHKQKAIDALSLAADELRQAMQFDNR